MDLCMTSESEGVVGYEDQRATRAALEQAEKHKREASRLTNAIAAHYRAVHNDDWGHDDELWAAVGLVADPDVVG